MEDLYEQTISLVAKCIKAQKRKYHKFEAFLFTEALRLRKELSDCRPGELSREQVTILAATALYGINAMQHSKPDLGRNALLEFLCDAAITMIKELENRGFLNIEYSDIKHAVRESILPIENRKRDLRDYFKNQIISLCDISNSTELNKLLKILRKPFPWEMALLGPRSELPSLGLVAKQKKKRGRPRKNSKKDDFIYQAWERRDYTSKKDLANAFNAELSEVERVINTLGRRARNKSE